MTARWAGGGGSGNLATDGGYRSAANSATISGGFPVRSHPSGEIGVPPAEARFGFGDVNHRCKATGWRLAGSRRNTISRRHESATLKLERGNTPGRAQLRGPPPLNAAGARAVMSADAAPAPSRA